MQWWKEYCIWLLNTDDTNIIARIAEASNLKVENLQEKDIKLIAATTNWKFS